jgi:hypothetical protein
MPRKSIIPEGHEGLSMRASNALWRFPDKDSLAIEIAKGFQVGKMRNVGKHTAQEILDWVGIDQEIIQPKWNVVSPGRVKIGRWVLTRSQVLAILAAMD